MQIAALLSDLKSLSVCSHSAALSLVNVHKHLDDDTTTNTNTNTTTTTNDFNHDQKRSASSDSDIGQSQAQSQAQFQSELGDARTDEDRDLKRANDLVALHYAVKVKYQESGLDKELLHARRVVGGVLTSLAQRG